MFIVWFMRIAALAPVALHVWRYVNVRKDPPRLPGGVTRRLDGPPTEDQLRRFRSKERVGIILTLIFLAFVWTIGPPPS